MTFKHLPNIQLLVKDIQVVVNYKQRSDPTNIAHKFPISPEKAINKWAKDRLTIAGLRNTAKITILESNAKEIELTLDKNFTGIFKNQQSHRYDTSINVKLEIFDKNKEQLAIITAKADQSTTVSEATSLSDRRKIWYNLVEKLMANFDKAMSSAINRHLQTYIFK